MHPIRITSEPTTDWIVCEFIAATLFDIIYFFCRMDEMQLFVYILFYFQLYFLEIGTRIERESECGLFTQFDQFSLSLSLFSPFNPLIGFDRETVVFMLGLEANYDFDSPEKGENAWIAYRRHVQDTGK